MQEPIVTVVYSHGRYGSPWYGFKIEALRVVALRMGVNMISVRYPETMTVEEMEQRLFDRVSDDVNVPGDLAFLSSSRGAYLSTRVAARVQELFATEEVRVDDDKVLPPRHVLGQFLIAPAFYIKPDYYPDQSPTPPSDLRTVIVHGLSDDVISCDNSVRFATAQGAELHLVAGGHRLNSQRDLLCSLFQNFLEHALADAKISFDAWSEQHEQSTSPPRDDMSPRTDQ
jgi:surfactin synthase thioesterase subunit